MRIKQCMHCNREKPQRKKLDLLVFLAVKPLCVVLETNLLCENKANDKSFGEQFNKNVFVCVEVCVCVYMLLWPPPRLSQIWKQKCIFKGLEILPPQLFIGQPVSFEFYFWFFKSELCFDSHLANNVLVCNNYWCCRIAVFISGEPWVEIICLFHHKSITKQCIINRTAAVRRGMPDTGQRNWILHRIVTMPELASSVDKRYVECRRSCIFAHQPMWRQWLEYFCVLPHNWAKKRHKP